MSNKQFISNLSATYADIRKLDVKKINLKGKNILEYINENSTVILDERGTLANDELDVWNSYITKDENGNVIVDMTPTPKEHDINTVTDEQLSVLRSSSKVINNEVLDADDNHLMYWQTDGLTVGGGLSMGGDYFVVKGMMGFYHDIVNNSSFTNTSLTIFNSCLSSLTDGYYMFYDCSTLTTFTSDLSSLTSGDHMFFECSALTTFNSDLSSLTNGKNMFAYCSNLTSFSLDLSSLTNGEYMFVECSALTTFTTDLSSLVNGLSMFNGCSALTTFTTDLNSLTDGSSMFGSCRNLTSFSSDLSSLTDGTLMFGGCSNLTTFNSNLNSLTDGNLMFNECKLDAQSVSNIITFLPTHESRGTILIGIGIANIEDDKQAFAEECYCDSWEELNQDFSDKNWNVQWRLNGEATTFDLRSPRPSTAVFSKLEEVIMPTENNTPKPHYDYTSQDGSKFYNIHWYHDSNTDNEGYDYFESLEEAISAYGVNPKA